MPVPQRQKGFVDIISIIIVVFLAATVFVGAKVTSDRNISLNLSNKAATLDQSKLDKQAKDRAAAEKEAAKQEAKKEKHAEKVEEQKAQENNGPKGSYEKLSTRQKASIDFDTYKTKLNNGEPVPTPTTETVSAPANSCDANGTSYSEGSVVVFSSGANDYRKCIAGRWATGYKITDLTTAYVPTYLQSTYTQAKADEQTKAQLAPHINADITNPAITQAKATCETNGGFWNSTLNICGQGQGNCTSFGGTWNAIIKTCTTPECVPGFSICDGGKLKTCSTNKQYLVSQICQYGCSNNLCNPPPVTADATVGQTSQNQLLTSTYNILNTVTFGGFGNYVQTYQNIAAQNPQANYLQQAFNPAGVVTTSTLPATITINAAYGRDIFIENAKYQINQITSDRKTIYIVELGRQVYEKDGIFYDANTNEPQGPVALYSGKHFIDKPTTVYDPQINPGIYAGASPNQTLSTIDPGFHPELQHITLTQEGLASPQFQNIYNQAKENVTPALTVDNLQTVTQTVNDNLPYYQPLNFMKQGSDVSVLENNIGVYGYQLTYKTLDNEIQNKSTICFDQSQIEFDVLTGLGYTPKLVNNYKLGHVYVVVKINGQDYVADPTYNKVVPLADHERENGYNATSDTSVIPSPLEALP